MRVSPDKEGRLTFFSLFGLWILNVMAAKGMYLYIHGQCQFCMTDCSSKGCSFDSHELDIYKHSVSWLHKRLNHT